MLNAIEEAVGRRLAGTTGIPAIVWPNHTIPSTRPFVAVQHMPTSNEAPALAGGGEVQRGSFVFTVVTAANIFAVPANNVADLIRARFPKGLVLVVSGRKLRLLTPLQDLPGFRDDPDWRQPMRLNYIVTAS